MPDPDTLYALRELAAGQVRTEARLSRIEDRQESAETALQPVNLHYAALNKAREDATAAAVVADQNAETTRKAWLAWLTPARLQLLIGIVGALAAGNVDRIVRAVRAFATVEPTEIVDAPAEDAVEEAP